MRGPTLVSGPDTFAVNPSYDGSPDHANMLRSGSLAAGELAHFQIELEVVGAGVYVNQVAVAGTDPWGEDLKDFSTNGTDPDPNGDGNPSEAQPSKLFLDNPVIGLAKRAEILESDPYLVRLIFTLENFGDVELTEVSIVDDLVATFGAGNFDIAAPPTVVVDNGRGIEPNPDFDGAGDKNLLDPASTLVPNGSARVFLDVSVPTPGSYENSALGGGRSVVSGTIVKDVSQDGDDPDPDMNDDPTDNDDPTIIDLVRPVIGVSKDMTASGTNPYLVAVDYYLENLGDVVISELSLEDDLDAVFGSGAWMLRGRPMLVSGPETVIPNDAYTGTGSDIDVVAGGSVAPGETAQIQVLLSVNVAGSYRNQVTVIGETPWGEPISDASTPGTDPDPNGDGNPDEEGPTVILLGTPILGAAKAVELIGVEPYLARYTVTVENLGDVDLSDLTITDDLDDTFGPGNYAIAAPPSIVADPGLGLTANADFDGSSDRDLIVPGGVLQHEDAVQTSTIQFDVEVFSPGTYANNASTSGLEVRPGGAPGREPGREVTDVSTNGLNPDPNGDGDPAEDEPTILVLSRPVIGVAKDMTSDGVRPYVVFIDYVLENFGDVTIRDLSMPDDLDLVFGAGNWAHIAGPSTTSTTVIVNEMFDGSGANTDLLAGGELEPGGTAAVQIAVRVLSAGAYENQVVLSGTDPDGFSLSDESTDGSDPDADGDDTDGSVDGDGNPNENEPTIIVLESPEISLTKSFELIDVNPFVVGFRLDVTNDSDVELNRVAIRDTLDNTFGAGNFDVMGTPTVVSDPGGRIVVNPGYDGSTDTNLLSEASALSAVSGENEASVMVEVEVFSPGSYLNCASADGRSIFSGELVSAAANDGVCLPVELESGMIMLTKRVTPERASVGDVVSYTIVAKNTSLSALDDIRVSDVLAPGFRYVVGSARLVSAGIDGVFGTRDDETTDIETEGSRPLDFFLGTLDGNETKWITYQVRLGASVTPGTYQNRATPFMNDEPAGNTATAVIRVVPDAVFDKTSIIGKVFQDLDRDGWQDPAGASGLQLKVDGGVDPGSIRIDYGEGMRSINLLGIARDPVRGLELGQLPGRGNLTDDAPEIKVSMRLRSDRMPEVIVTSDEGTRLVLTREGRVISENRGGVLGGTNAQNLTLSHERRGNELTLTVRNEGVEERGIPGARLATPTGLLIETDAYGRYHIADVDAGTRARGRNLMVKVDPASLPEGSEFTTENPRVLHATPSIVNQFDFGVFPAGMGAARDDDPKHAKLKIAKSVTKAGIASGPTPVDRIILDSFTFATGSARVRADARAELADLAGRIREIPGASVVIEGHTDSRPISNEHFKNNYELSKARADAVRRVLVREHGVDRSRVSSFGYGADKPVADEDTPEGLQANRRVEVLILSQRRLDVRNDADVDVNRAPRTPDAVRYQLLMNYTGEVDLASITVEDLLPLGSGFVFGSATWNSQEIPDPVIEEVDGRQLLRWRFEGADMTGENALRYGVLLNDIDTNQPVVNHARVIWATEGGEGGASPTVAAAFIIPTHTSITGGRVGDEPVLEDIVFFDTAKAKLRSDAVKTLNDLLDKVARFESVSVELAGHADIRPINTPLYPNNMVLSDARASRVQEYLDKNAPVSIKAITSEAFGTTRPRAFGMSPDALQENRRVEIGVYNYDTSVVTTAARDVTRVEIPGTPSEVEVHIYQSGASRADQAGRQLKVTLNDSFFEEGTTVIRPENRIAIDEIARSLEERGGGVIVIEGSESLRGARRRAVMENLRDVLGDEALDQLDIQVGVLTLPNPYAWLDRQNWDMGEAFKNVVKAGVRLLESLVASTAHAGELDEGAFTIELLDDGSGQPTGTGDGPLVRLTSGAGVWITADPTDVRGRLNVLGPSSVSAPVGNIAGPVPFAVYTNYAAFIDGWELVIYAADDQDRTRPVWVESGLGLEETIFWDGEVNRAVTSGTELLYVLRVTDGDGHWDETAPRALFLSPDDVRSTIASDLRRSIFGVSNLEFQTVPLRGARVRVHGVDIPQGHSISVMGQRFVVDETGRGVAEQILPFGRNELAVETWAGGADRDPSEPTLRPRIDVPDDSDPVLGKRMIGTDGVERALIPVEVGSDYFFLVGLANVTVGGYEVNGNPATVEGDYHFDDDVFADGRLAFYQRALIDGRVRIVTQLDSREERLEDLFENIDRRDPERFFRRLDPDQYYTTFGDGSVTTRDVDTQGRIYGRVEWDDSRAMWGNFNTGVTGTEYGQFNRTMYGALLDVESTSATAFGDKRLELTGFGSEPETRFAHNEFTGTGGSLYYLRHTDVVEGSEKVWIEVRDRDSDRVLETHELHRYRDYEFDDLQGRVILARPLLQIADEIAPDIIKDDVLDGNRALLLVDYEYITTGIESGDLTIGGRGTAWPADEIGLGGTYVSEERDGQDYTLTGGDVTLRVRRGTYLKGEYAETEATQASAQLLSVDGGLTFRPITQVSTGDLDGQAFSIEGRLDVNEIIEAGGVPTVAGWYKERDAGFSTARLAGGTEVTDYGAELDWRPANWFGASGRFTSTERKGIEEVRKLTGQAGIRAEALSVTGEVRHLETEPDGGSTVSATLAGGRVGIDVRPGVHVYVSGQTVLDSDDEYEDNDLVSVGARARMHDRVSLHAEGASGDRGNSALVGLDVRVDPAQELYGTYTLSTDRIDGDRGVATVGQRRTISNQLSVFSENQFTSGDRQSGLGQIYGLTLHPCQDWSVTGTYQRSDLDDRDIGEIDRQAGSLGLTIRESSSRFSFRGEVREDSGAIEQRQYVTANRADVTLSPSWSVVGKLNYSVTESEDEASGNEIEFNEARFAETGLGIAYRPAYGDRLNLLAKHTFLYDLPSLGQRPGATDRRLNVFSGEGIWKLSRRINLGTHLAHRRGEIRSDRDSGEWTKTEANLAALNARYNLPFNWDALAEYRWLWVNETDELNQGALAGLYRHIGPHVKLGAGYNFTDFSDDLTDLDFDYHGWFVSLIGKY